jgi:hypothetical protein
MELVEFSGPPSVMMSTWMNRPIAAIVMVMSTNTNVGLSSGKVMWRNRSHGVVPSSAAAS